MNLTQAAARQAGILYLVLAIAAFFSFVYIPSTFIVPGDATATARNIMAGER